MKVRAPTLANVQVVAHMLKDGYLADTPIVIAAIDPCFSCTDRAISTTNLDNGRTDRMDWPTLQTYGIEWYRRQGIDFSELNRKLRTMRESS